MDSIYIAVVGLTCDEFVLLFIRLHKQYDFDICLMSLLTLSVTSEVCLTYDVLLTFVHQVPQLVGRASAGLRRGAPTGRRRAAVDRRVPPEAVRDDHPEEDRDPQEQTQQQQRPQQSQEQRRQQQQQQQHHSQHYL